MPNREPQPHWLGGNSRDIMFEEKSCFYNSHWKLESACTFKRECCDLVLVDAGVRYLSGSMSTRPWIILKNVTSWFLVRLASSVSDSKWSSIDVTLLVLRYLLVTYRAALRCTISIFLMNS